MVWNPKDFRPPPIVRPSDGREFHNSSDAVFFAIKLKPTDEPVWPEDEEAERAPGPSDGAAFPASSDDAERLVKKVELSLPDRLFGARYRPSTASLLDTDRFDYFGFSLPTAMLTERGVTARRLRLRLTLAPENAIDPALPPVVCCIQPGPDIAVEVVQLGALNIDLGKAVQLFWPGAPDVFSAHIGTGIDIKKIKPRIQVAGLMTTFCEWRVADTVLSYNLNGRVVAQVPKRSGLILRAELHVEVRQKVLGVFYKAYGVSAEPREYVLHDRTEEAPANPPVMPNPSGVDPDRPVAFAHLTPSELQNIRSSQAFMAELIHRIRTVQRGGGYTYATYLQDREFLMALRASDPETWQRLASKYGDSILPPGVLDDLDRNGQ